MLQYDVTAGTYIINSLICLSLDNNGFVLFVYIYYIGTSYLRWKLYGLSAFEMEVKNVQYIFAVLILPKVAMLTCCIICHFKYKSRKLCKYV